MKHSWNVWIFPNVKSGLPTAAGTGREKEVKRTGAGSLVDGWLQEGGGGGHTLFTLDNTSHYSFGTGINVRYRKIYKTNKIYSKEENRNYTVAIVLNYMDQMCQNERPC